jgi:primosomal protein N'
METWKSEKQISNEKDELIKELRKTIAEKEQALQLLQANVVRHSEQFNCDGCRWYNSCALRIDYNNVRCEEFDNN